MCFQALDRELFSAFRLGFDDQAPSDSFRGASVLVFVLWREFRAFVGRYFISTTFAAVDTGDWDVRTNLVNGRPCIAAEESYGRLFQVLRSVFCVVRHFSFALFEEGATLLRLDPIRLLSVCPRWMGTQEDGTFAPQSKELKMRKMIALAGAVAVLNGCASSSIDYRPPAGKPVTNTKEISVPFDQAWDTLVRQLSSDFFVINNIDKNSRLINLSFSTQKPSDFVDCGTTNRVFENGRGKRNYSYASADSSDFSVTNDKSIAFNMSRRSKLEGRVNIYLAPSGTGTSVAVNSKYALQVNWSAVGFDGSPGGSGSNTFDFSTKQGYVAPELTCYAKGTLEQKILEMVN
jgi:hypothetical protein